MSKTLTIETFAELEAAESEVIKAAKAESEKKLKAMLKEYDFSAEETSLIEGLRNLYRIHERAKSVLGDKIDFRPSPLTANLRGGRRGKANAGGGGKGEKSAAVIQEIKSAGNPLTVADIAKKLGEPENNIRQRLFNLVQAGELVSLKQDGDKYRKPVKGERGGFYGLSN